MKLSELKKEVDEALEDYGDVEVVYFDAGKSNELFAVETVDVWGNVNAYVKGDYLFVVYV